MSSLPLLVYLSLSTAAHSFWVQGNQKAKSLSHSETERRIIEKIIFGVPAMIWKVLKWWKFPSKILHTNITTQKTFPKTSRHTFWHVCVYSRCLVNHFGRYIFIQTHLLLDKAASNLTDCIVILCAFRTWAIYNISAAPLSSRLHLAKKSCQHWRLAINASFDMHIIIWKNIFTYIVHFYITYHSYILICPCLWLFNCKKFTFSPTSSG